MEEIQRITTAEGVLDAFDRIVNFSLSLMIVLATVYFIYVAVMFATAKGDEKKADLAKKQLLYAVIAIALIILANSAFDIISGFISGQESEFPGADSGGELGGPPLNSWFPLF